MLVKWAWQQHKNDKVLTQGVGSGWGSFCAFTVGIAKKIRRLITNRDQMLVKWAWQQHVLPQSLEKVINSN